MPKEAPLPFEKPGWFKSRKFLSAIITTAALWAVALKGDDFGVGEALLASSPLLAWLGVEGVVDAVGAAKKK